MTNHDPAVCPPDLWQILKRFTNARIALGRAGMSQPTGAHLAFQLAHARARDAVNLPLDFDKLEKELEDAGLETIRLSSAAPDHHTYLQRPDKGRLLDAASQEKFAEAAGQSRPDIAVVICDGLSSSAIAHHAARFTRILVRALSRRSYRIAPVCLVARGRVAVGDQVGERLFARMAVVLIGERPGLSSPDSMGIYFTYGPRTGATDADRNCISNIHANGLSHEAALEKLLFLITEADRRKLSGTRLKDETPALLPRTSHDRERNFLLA